MRKVILSVVAAMAMLSTTVQAEDFWKCDISDGGHVYLTQIKSGFPLFHLTNDSTPQNDLFIRATLELPAYYHELRHERYVRFVRADKGWSYVIQSGERNGVEFNRITLYNEDGHQIITDDCSEDDSWFPNLWTEKAIVDEYDDLRIIDTFSNVDEIW